MFSPKKLLGTLKQSIDERDVLDMLKYPILFIFILSLLISYSMNIVIAENSTSILFNDSDINEATLQLENQRLSREGLSNLLSKTTTSTSKAKINTLGYMYYISHNPNDTNPWQAIRYNLDEHSSTTIYAGGYEVQSIAGSADGNIIILNIKHKTKGISNLEIYRLYIRPKSVHRLTETVEDEINVSSSADGRHVVWQQEDNGFNKIYGRIYLDDKATAVYQDFLLDHFKSQRDPSISSDGRYLALVRNISNDSDWIYLYDLYKGDYQLVTQSPDSKMHPSVSANGQKVVWLVVDGANQIAQLKDLNVNTIITVINNGLGINHPYITADGDWLSYSQEVNGVWQVRIQNLVTDAVNKVDSLASKVNVAGMYWQKPNSKSGDNIMPVAKNSNEDPKIQNSSDVSPKSNESNLNIDLDTGKSHSEIIATAINVSDKPLNTNTVKSFVSALKTKKIPSDVVAFNRFGSSISIDGNTMVVGINHNTQKGSATGSAYVLEKVNNDWTFTAKLTASDGKESDRLGMSVAISGDTVIVGCPPSNAKSLKSGTAYIFERNKGGANNWGEVAKLVAGDGTWGDQFGISVSIFNDTAVVGADLADNNVSDTGKAYVFERNANGHNNWGETKVLLANDGGAKDHFGKSVDIYDDLIVVGAPTANINGIVDDGAVYVFERNAVGADKWEQIKKLAANNDNEAEGLFGTSVAIFENAVVIGANGESNSSTSNGHAGAAYIFERNVSDGKWTNVRRLVTNDTKEITAFGFAVDIYENVVVVGAYKDSKNAELAGAAYIFDRNKGGSRNWGEVRKLFANDGAKNDLYGKSVAISADIVAVGSPQKNNEDIIDTGSLYIYE